MTAFDMRDHIRESNAIEGIHDPGEVDQSMKAWEYLLTRDQLTHFDVCTVQGLICANQADLRGVQKGHYRSVSKVNVRVGPHVAPAWQDVDRLMGEWLDACPSRSPWENHVAFETVHPFVDGNGRTGRLILFWQQIREGQSPSLIKAADRFEYYEHLQRGRETPEERDAYARRMLGLLDARGRNDQ